MFNNLTIKFILLFAALFFYALNCFVPFNGEIVYTIDFILILLIVFYLITGSKKFESRSEEHTSELQSLMRISYAVFCFTKKNNTATKAISVTPNDIIHLKTTNHTQ